MNDNQRRKRLTRIRKESTGQPVDTITVKAMHGQDYTVSRQGRMFAIARATPDGQFVHRVMCSRHDACKIADAIVDLYERDAAT